MAKTSTPARYDPRVDAKIAAAPKFAQPILRHLRELVHAGIPDIVEDIKWSRAFFVLDGELVCQMAAFTKHCGFGFWSPSMTEILAKDGIAEVEGAGSLGRIVSLSDLPTDAAMTRYLHRAANLARSGAAACPMTPRVRASGKAPIPMPLEFEKALGAASQAKTNFEALPPSCRREYLEWITSAKRTETKERRVVEAVARLGEGKRFNEQYRSVTK